jgi:hypothetical protein
VAGAAIAGAETGAMVCAAAAAGAHNSAQAIKALDMKIPPLEHLFYSARPVGRASSNRLLKIVQNQAVNDQV